MGQTVWIRFDPSVGNKSARQRYLRHAIDLSKVVHAEDHAARRALLERTRRQVAGGGGDSSLGAPVRAAVLVLADLIAQGWKCRLQEGGVEIAKPSASQDLAKERERVRQQLAVERDRQLQAPAVREFVNRMERRRFHRGHWVSVFSLMRDGVDFARELRRLRGIPDTIQPEISHSIIRPYIQVVRHGETCEQTGLSLLDIWRYFRHTWANPYRSAPGRSLMLLVRDAAIDPHPVIGIAALASSAVQISVRDDWIGWSAEACVDQLRHSANERHVHWLLGLVADGLANLYLDDLLDPAVGPLTRRALAEPSPEVIMWLGTYARSQRDVHHRFADAGEHKGASLPDVVRDENWQRRAETPLFRSKRAETLAMLLRARAALDGGEGPLTAPKLQAILESSARRQAVQALVRRAKSERVGVAMADISVCGALPPYSAVLGGKLVAMLLLSPEVIAAYRDRYAGAQSVIASSLAGRPIVRQAHLAFLGTTSLYGTEPTQYTRVTVPCGILGGRQAESLRYRLLGRTKGYGTLQFSPDTVHALSVVLSQTQGGQRVHSIFGEGVNPRLRKVRSGLDRLGLPSDLLLTHGSPRLVYGVALARNFREYLLGLDHEPEYLVTSKVPAAATERIALSWVQRWLVRRVMRDEVLDEAARHQLVYPIRHGARVSVPGDESDQLSFFDDNTGVDS